MAKFCGGCGSNVSDNAKFCPACSSDLSQFEYKPPSQTAEGVFNRSNVGQSSVGNVNISPTMNQSQTVYSGAVCNFCGAPPSGNCVKCAIAICNKHYFRYRDRYNRPGNLCLDCDKPLRSDCCGAPLLLENIKNGEFHAAVCLVCRENSLCSHHACIVKILEDIPTGSHTFLEADSRIFFCRGCATDEVIRGRIQVVDPQGFNPYYERARNLIKQEKLDEALGALEEALRVAPKHHESVQWKGFVLERLGRYEDALDEYALATFLDPKDTYSWERQAVLHMNNGDYPEALQALDMALQLNPNNADGWHNRGLLLEYLQRFEEADESFAKAQQLGRSPS